MGGAFFMRRVTRIEPGFSRLERMEPVPVVPEQAAFGADLVEGDIDQHAQAVLARLVCKHTQTFARGRVGFEYGMEFVMIGHGLSMAVAARLERCADQDVIEAQRGGMFKVRGPCRQWSDEKRVDEIDSWCVCLKHVMVFHRSSFPVRPAMAWMRENAIALNQAINQTARTATADEPQTVFKAPIPG